MIQNKRFALCFRLVSLLFALIGLLSQIGVFRGDLSSAAFMYYTIQSNLLAAALFAFLAVSTAKCLRESARGSLGMHTRVGMICAVDLLVTMVVFWALLVPMVPADYLWTFDNIAVHTVTPLLCLVDYILFSQPKRLKYRDVYYVCIFPLCYVLFSVIAGLAGYVYYYSTEFGGAFYGDAVAAPVRFPYFFLDFDRLGAMAVVYSGGILLFFLLLSHAIFLIDRKVRKPS